MHFFSPGRSNVLKFSGRLFHDTSPSKNVFHRSGDEAVIFARCCAIHRQLKDRRGKQNQLDPSNERKSVGFRGTKWRPPPWNGLDPPLFSAMSKRLYIIGIRNRECISLFSSVGHYFQKKIRSHHTRLASSRPYGASGFATIRILNK